MKFVKCQNVKREMKENNNINNNKKRTEKTMYIHQNYAQENKGRT